MVELPWVHAYATDDLYAGRRTPWAIFRSQWALAAAVVLLETFRNRRVLWRFSARLLHWVGSVGPSNICVNAEGTHPAATAILGARLNLADQFRDTEAFLQRLCARSTDHRNLEGWVWAALEADDDGTRAKVAKDLFNPEKHRDIPDAAFDQLEYIPSDRVPQGLARVMVTASRLPVSANVQRECAFYAGQHIVRSGRAGPELVLGPRVTIDENPVPHVDVLVDRPHAGVVVPFVPLLCQLEKPPYALNQTT